MHEQIVVESLLALVLEEAEKAEASKILKINIVVGELSGVLDEAVDFYFSFLSKDTIAAGASLSFEHIPAKMRCRNCDTVFSPEEFDLHCPNCNERQVEIVGGRELYIESLEVE